MPLRTLLFAAALSAFVSLAATSANATVAISANDFLISVGVNPHIRSGWLAKGPKNPTIFRLPMGVERPATYIYAGRYVSERFVSGRQL
jgi:hypothetical protein